MGLTTVSLEELLTYMRGRRRGRRPGVYRLNHPMTAIPESTEALEKVITLLQQSRRGLQARTIAETLSMPPGTVAWAIHVLRKYGQVQRITPTRFSVSQ